VVADLRVMIGRESKFLLRAKAERFVASNGPVGSTLHGVSCLRIQERITDDLWIALKKQASLRSSDIFALFRQERNSFHIFGLRLPLRRKPFSSESVDLLGSKSHDPRNFCECWFNY
jgi:hypothetical protein